MTHDKNDRFWELSLAINAAFKGLLGSMGQSGHICNHTTHISHILDLSVGWTQTIQNLVDLILAKGVEAGDVIVIPDKIVAVSQKRIGPRTMITDPDPKKIHPDQLDKLAQQYQETLGFRLDRLHLLIADEYGDDLACFGAEDHNRAAFQLAEAITQKSGLPIDVIISDTDTGLDVKSPLIGSVTIGATPLGATQGVNLYESMRCAVAAEFVRGHDKYIPVVICKPADRCRKRPGMGEKRTYSGALHIAKEGQLTYV